MSGPNSPTNTLQQYLNYEFSFSRPYENFRNELEDFLKKAVNAINTKDIAQYYDGETITGQQWFIKDNVVNVRIAVRKVIDVGALNDFSSTPTQTVAHGITIDSNIEVTRIYGAATDPSTGFIPLPYVDMAGPGHHIQLSMDATNITLISDADYSAYTQAYVVVEFVANPP